MKINKTTALQLWEKYYGTSLWAKDFHDNLMFRDAYGNDGAWAYPTGFSYSLGNNYSIACSLIRNKIYCGWNIHHILPKTNGGTNEKNNLVCTNIIKNEVAEDKTTFWIDDCNYQVQRKPGTSEYEIVRLNPINTTACFIGK